TELDRLLPLPGFEKLGAALFRGWAAAELRGLAEQLTFRCDPEHLSADERRRLADKCRELWDSRDEILAHADPGDPGWEIQVRADLRDVALRGLELRGWPADDARRLMDELQAFNGPSAMIDLERAVLAGGAIPAPDLSAPQSATELHLLGRSYR